MVRLVVDVLICKAGRVLFPVSSSCGGYGVVRILDAFLQRLSLTGIKVKIYRVSSLDLRFGELYTALFVGIPVSLGESLVTGLATSGLWSVC